VLLRLRTLVLGLQEKHNGRRRRRRHAPRRRRCASIYGGVVMLDLNMGIKQVSIRVDKYLQQLLASTDDNDYVDPMIYYVCYLMWRKCGGNRKSERVRAIAQPSLS
jgi:hypothetical protein